MSNMNERVSEADIELLAKKIVASMKNTLPPSYCPMYVLQNDEKYRSIALFSVQKVTEGILTNCQGRFLFDKQEYPCQHASDCPITRKKLIEI